MNVNRQTVLRMALLWCGVFLALLVASCANVEREYPAQWTDLNAELLIGECPAISGVYVELGDAPEGCQYTQDFCNSLTYSFLSGGIGYPEVYGKGDANWPTSQYMKVRLHQPTDKVLVITATDRHETPVLRETLRMDEGDFTCDGKNLNLKQRSIAVFFGFSNAVGSVSRSFSRAGDGALIMESTERGLIHYYIMAIGSRENVWVRWRRADMPESDGPVKSGQWPVTERSGYPEDL